MFYCAVVTGGRGRRSQQQLDRILQAQCHGEAWRRVVAGEPIEEIVTELRQMIGAKSILLVEAGAVVAGCWVARPTPRGTELIVAGVLLAAAGRIDSAELKHHAEIGRLRALAGPHGAR